MKKEMTIGEFLKNVRFGYFVCLIGYALVRGVLWLLGTLGIAGTTGYVVTSLGLLAVELVVFPLFGVVVAIGMLMFCYMVVSEIKSIFTKV